MAVPATQTAQAKIHLFPQDAVVGLYNKVSGQVGCLTPPKQHSCRYRIGKEPTVTPYTVNAPWLWWLATGGGAFYIYQVEESQLPKFVITPYAIANVDPVSAGICYHDTYPKNLMDAYSLFWTMAFDDSMGFRFFDHPGAPKSYAHRCLRPRTAAYPSYPQHRADHSCPNYTLPDCRASCLCCRGTCDCWCTCCDGSCYCWGKRAAVPAHREWALQLFTDFQSHSRTWIRPDYYQREFSIEGWEIASGYRGVALFPDQNYRRAFANPQDPEVFTGPWLTDSGEVFTPLGWPRD